MLYFFIFLRCFSAISLSIDKSGDIETIAKALASNIIQFYTANPDGSGAIAQNSATDISGIQWYESGIMWGAINEYSRTFTNSDFLNITAKALSLASHGSIGSFLGPSSELAATLQGKWNDDIMWYSFAVLVGTELYGTAAEMPDGNTYLRVTQNTYDEVWQQYDTSCGGGIYWSRYRNDPDRSRAGYKSVITNAQHILLGSRLYLLTKNQTYLTNAQVIYSWIKSSGIFDSNGKVYDGVNAYTSCSTNQEELSYNAGTLLAAMGFLYKATKEVTLLSEANLLLQNFKTKFTINDVVTDSCENNCKQDQVMPKGTAIRGLGSNINLKNRVLCWYNSKLE